MSITEQLRNHTVQAVITNGEIVIIQTYSGKSIQIAWVDEQGKPIKGRPVLYGEGLTFHAADIKQ